MATLSNLAMVTPINQWLGCNRRCGSLALKRGQQISLKGADCLYLGKKDPLIGMKPGPCVAGHRSMAQSCRWGGLAASKQSQLQGETRWLWALSRPVANISKEDFHPCCANLSFSSPHAGFSLITTRAGSPWILLTPLRRAWLCLCNSLGS